MTKALRPKIPPIARTSSLQAPSRQAIIRAREQACRDDFASFTEMCFDLLTPGKSLLMAPYIEAVAYHLEQVRLGRVETTDH